MFHYDSANAAQTTAAPMKVTDRDFAEEGLSKGAIVDRIRRVIELARAGVEDSHRECERAGDLLTLIRWLPELYFEDQARLKAFRRLVERAR